MELENMQAAWSQMSQELNKRYYYADDTAKL